MVQPPSHIVGVHLGEGRTVTKCLDNLAGRCGYVHAPTIALSTDGGKRQTCDVRLGLHSYFGFAALGIPLVRLLVSCIVSKTKISVSLDPGTLAQAQALAPSASVSELLDVALKRLINEELERQHVAGYEKLPVGNEFTKWANISRIPETDNEVDWAALYGVTK